MWITLKMIRLYRIFSMHLLYLILIFTSCYSQVKPDNNYFDDNPQTSNYSEPYDNDPDAVHSTGAQKSGNIKTQKFYPDFASNVINRINSYKLKHTNKTQVEDENGGNLQENKAENNQDFITISGQPLSQSDEMEHIKSTTLRNPTTPITKKVYEYEDVDLDKQNYDEEDQNRQTKMETENNEVGDNEIERNGENDDNSEDNSPHKNTKIDQANDMEIESKNSADVEKVEEDLQLKSTNHEEYTIESKNPHDGRFEKKEESIQDTKYLDKSNMEGTYDVSLQENELDLRNGHDEHILNIDDPAIERVDNAKNSINEPDDTHLVEEEDPMGNITLGMDGYDKDTITPQLNDPSNHTILKTNKWNKQLSMPFHYKIVDPNARVFCTFRQNVQYMYKEIKKNFVGDLCHGIVYGVPLIIGKREINIKKNIQKEIKNIKTYKKRAHSIVIMKHKSYEDWSDALDNIENEVNIIMNFVRKYDIDGVQFSNLQPTAQDQLDIDMLCKIIIFFEKLLKSSEKHRHELKIGVTICSYCQSITTSFESFETLNKMISWYSVHTISMVKCAPQYLSGTSPLYGDISLSHTIDELMKTDIDKSKIIIGIQLYPNEIGKLKASSYEKMCLSRKNTWNHWCAARPEHFRAKGEYLRNLEICGVQLFYIEHDDFKNKCKCHEFPMIRALLRGLANQKQPEKCAYLGEAVDQNSTCSYNDFLNDIEERYTMGRVSEDTMVDKEENAATEDIL